MPNHCYQTVLLRGEPKEIDRLYEAVKERKFLSAVIPEPENMFHGNLGDDERKMCDIQDRPNWYDWRNENWDTKWDITAVEIVEELQDDNHYPIPVKYFKFKCWTAWSPPLPIWRKLHEMGIEVFADYIDEGGWFEGEFKEGEKTSWKPEENPRFGEIYKEYNKQLFSVYPYYRLSPDDGDHFTYDPEFVEFCLDHEIDENYFAEFVKKQEGWSSEEDK